MIDPKTAYTALKVIMDVINKYNDAKLKEQIKKEVANAVKEADKGDISKLESLLND